MTMTVTTNEASRFYAGECKFDKSTLLTVAGVDDIAKGTILARSSATGLWVLYDIDGVTAGNNIPGAVLAHRVVTTGGGNVPVEVVIEGSIYRDRLIVDADGDGDSLTPAILDELRQFGIIAVSARDLTVLDNQ